MLQTKMHARTHTDRAYNPHEKVDRTSLLVSRSYMLECNCRRAASMIGHTSSVRVQSLGFIKAERIPVYIDIDLRVGQWHMY